jgi:hypothetical protein
MKSYETAQVEAMVEACSAQHEQLTFIAQHLPSFLPGGTAAQVPTSSAAAAGPSCTEEAHNAPFGDENAPSNPQSRPSSAETMGTKKKRAPAPRRCTTHSADRLGGCSFAPTFLQAMLVD